MPMKNWEHQNCQLIRATDRASTAQQSRKVVVVLRGKYTGFSVDDLLLLIGSWIAGALSVDERGIDCLALQARLAAIPHDGSQSAQVRRG